MRSQLEETAGPGLERNRPGCPQDNPAHERLHLDISRELEKPGLGEQQATFDEWRRSFNEERPHEALAMRTPSELYIPSVRKFAGTPEDLTYSGMESRKVQTHEKIHWQGHSFFISTALQGWSVGVQALDDRRCSLWFGRLLLGELDVSAAIFEPAKTTPASVTPEKSAARRAEKER